MSFIAVLGHVGCNWGTLKQRSQLHLSTQLEQPSSKQMRISIAPTAPRARQLGVGLCLQTPFPLSEGFINTQVVSGGLLLVGSTEVPAEGSPAAGEGMAEIWCFYHRAELEQSLATNTWARQTSPRAR